MNRIRAGRSLVLLFCSLAMVAATLALTSATDAQARPCCWVTVCDDVGCYHRCVVCPKFP